MEHDARCELKNEYIGVPRWANTCRCQERALEAERDALRLAEKEVSDAYLRVRALLGAYDTAPGGTDRYEVTENAIKALRLRVAALEAAIAEWRRTHPWDTRSAPLDARESEDALWVTVNNTTALRAMLVEAYFTGAEDWDSFAEYKTARKRAAEGYADRILGASKGGGE